MDRTRSNNGGKTKPLTPASIAVLRQLNGEDIPCRSINPGIIDRLTRMPNPLATVIYKANPFKSSQKSEPEIGHLHISEVGKLELVSRGLK